METQYVLCSKCHYPIKVDSPGQRVKCPYCGTEGIAEEVKVIGRILNDTSSNPLAQGEGVVLPAWLVAGGVGFLLGIIFGPAIMTSSREGAQRLAKIAEEKLKSS